MQVLLSNDDGVNAPGLAALRAVVDDLGHVAVVAPESPQSAAGHAITVHQPLKVTRLDSPGPGEFKAISVDGRPADCVRLAIKILLAERPDLVLSGINAGANVGINVFYSGTVAAAAEAAMCGIPAVAFSAAAEGGDIDYPRAAELCRWVLDRLLGGGIKRGDLVNVNIPTLGDGRPRGVRFVPQSTAGMEDTYHGQRAADGDELYRLGDDYSFHHQADSDVACLAEGYITITPLHVDMTNHDRLLTLGRLPWSDPPGRT
ncbi:MAG TPA: 5'/3'-nucleotidase SurE [Phycisphaerae bacterium]|nr:5'/3'-nucleotidase SurE [Phycisphaerae bacterium]